MASTELYSCTNCYQEEEASHWDVDEITGEFLCSGCKAHGKDSPEAAARRDQNRDGALRTAIPFMAGLRREWSQNRSVKKPARKRGKK